MNAGFPEDNMSNMELRVLVVVAVLLLSSWVCDAAYPDNSGSENQKMGRMIPKIVKSLQENATRQEERINDLSAQLVDACLINERQTYQISILDFLRDKPDFEVDQNGLLEITETAQSSSHSLGPSDRAVDGDKRTQWWDNTCTHTAENVPVDDPTWWQGKLRYFSKVDRVKITNRGDCCAFRLADFVVEGYDKDPQIYSDQTAKVCNSYGGSVGLGVTETITCTTPIEARYMRVYKPMGDILTICEFEAEGSLAFDVEQLGNAVQSSSNRKIHERRAWRALDRDSETCTETDIHQHDDHWWQLDMGEAKTVNSVTITNRNDDKYVWLKDIVASVYEHLPTHCIVDEVTEHTCKTHQGPIGKGEAVTLTCDTPVQGRYLRIKKKRIPEEALSLCDVLINA